MSNKILLASMAWYVSKWIGKPYVWGGDDFSGFDCSGLIHEVLQAVGLENRGHDCTAHDIYMRYPIESHVEEGYTGCLVFWFSGNRAIHVEMMIDEYSIIGATGTGKPKFDIDEWLTIPSIATFYIPLKSHMQKTFIRLLKFILFKDQAIQDNAYIMMNPLNYRGNVYKIIDPTKGLE